MVLSGALSFCCLPDTLLSSFGGTIVTLFENHLICRILQHLLQNYVSFGKSQLLNVANFDDVIFGANF